MLSLVVQNVYIDKEWVVKEYLRRCNAGVWKKENTQKALKCQNLEHILDAELAGKKKLEECTMDDVINLEHGSPLCSDDVDIVD